MIKVADLSTAVELGVTLSKSLRPYTFPNAPSYMEVVYLPYRIWTFPVDGSDIAVHLTDFEVDENYARNLQIYSTNLITLPFYIVFKVAAAYLGLKNMVFFYFVRDGRQIFCWTTLTDKDGNTVEYSKSEVKIEYYMGHEYASLID